MDPSLLDLSHGKTFSVKVRSLFGSSVTSLNPDDHASFWLVAAFSRSRFRLDEHSVGVILHSCLGGQENLFAVVELEQNIFKFTVASKHVGFLVYQLKSFQCHAFKIFFHLWNEKCIDGARRSVLLDSVPLYDWQEVKAKKLAPNPSSVLHSIPAKHVFNSISSDINKGSAKQSFPKCSIFSRLDFNATPDHVLTNSALHLGKIWIPKSKLAPQVSDSILNLNSPSIGSGDNQGINLSLNLGPSPKPSFVEVLKNGQPLVLSGANLQHLGPFNGRNLAPSLSPKLVSVLGSPQWSRYFSMAHPHWACYSRIRCGDCFHFGHVSASCSFHPRFPGLSAQPSFTNQIAINAWTNATVQGWFHGNKSLPGGTSTLVAPYVCSLSSWPWDSSRKAQMSPPQFLLFCLGRIPLTPPLSIRIAGAEHLPSRLVILILNHSPIIPHCSILPPAMLVQMI